MIPVYICRNEECDVLEYMADGTFTECPLCNEQGTQSSTTPSKTHFLAAMDSIDSENIMAAVEPVVFVEHTVPCKLRGIGEHDNDRDCQCWCHVGDVPWLGRSKSHDDPAP